MVSVPFIRDTKTIKVTLLKVTADQFSITFVHPSVICVKVNCGEFCKY